jgi:hypothetical protein
MARIGVFLALIAVAIVAAGIFGALHNQVTYSVGPDYFHQFKFLQFGIPPETPPRIGAAIVGWRASWWMGVLVGSPPFLLGLLLLSSARMFWSARLRAIFAVLLMASLAASIGWVFGLMAVDAKTASQIQLPATITEPVGFLRAGVMHDASFVGGFVGIFAAIWIMFRASRHSQ